MDVLIQEDRLRGLKGLGDSTREKVEELVRSGKLAFYEDLKSKTPPGIFELLEIPGLGPKKIKALKDQLQVDSVEKLQQACQSGEVEKLSGFGAKTQSKLIEGIELRKQFASRHSLSSAWSAALPILEALRSHPASISCEIAGSLRRFKETIGDMDFLVSTNQPGEIAAFFAGLEQVNKVLVQGETKVSVLLDRGIQADLRLVSDA